MAAHRLTRSLCSNGSHLRSTHEQGPVMYPDPEVVNSECLNRERQIIHAQLGIPSGIGPQARYELLTGGTPLHTPVRRDSALIVAIRQFVRAATRGGRGHEAPTPSSRLTVPSVGATPPGS